MDDPHRGQSQVSFVDVVSTFLVTLLVDTVVVVVGTEILCLDSTQNEKGPF